MNPEEEIADFLASDTIEIAKREPIDCIMKTCTSTRWCCFPRNCGKRPAEYSTPK